MRIDNSGKETVEEIVEKTRLRKGEKFGTIRKKKKKKRAFPHHAKESRDPFFFSFI
jgi:transposase